MKAIETEYAGCLFRSRLEARWAVFFDHLEVEWEHEPEGFETSAGRYLPDFRIDLPSSYAISEDGRVVVDVPYMWFEVKPPGFDLDLRHQAFVDESEFPLVVAQGMSRDARSQIEHRPAPLVLLCSESRPTPVWFTWDPLGAILECFSPDGVPGERQVNAAYRAARSARFGT